MRIARISSFLLLVTLGMASYGAWAQTLEKSRITLAVGGKKGMKEVYGGAYHAGCIYAPADWVRKNPNTAQAVVNAMVRAVLWLQKARTDEVIATVPPASWC